ncbi:MAG: hypothetical protein BGO95_02455 [Micrococcales bacterium 73-13]|nr:MAG: hypothetical protein BGO95_02455 [Micrococcales bacterium 73-13]
MTSRRPLLRIATPVAALALASLGLAGCAGGAAPDGGGTAAPDGRISVVAVTDVYGDIAGAIGGDLVSVESLISGSAQDPHSFEATAQDQLAVADADVVIVNGGGYDDFMGTLLAAAGGDAVVLDAVELSGLPGAGEDGFNEHVWYSFDAVERVATQLADTLGGIAPSSASVFDANLATFVDGVDALKARAAGIAKVADGAGTLVTEPVPLYLLEASGFENLTPEAFSEAVEEGTDISPALLDEVLRLVQGGTVALFAYNSQTAGPEAETVRAAAETAGVAVVSFTETLPDGEDYLSWMSANLDAVSAALG